MIIQTSRFGKVQLENDHLINFPEGLLGFAHLRTFILLDDPTDEIFAWLQSCEEPGVAFPVLEPELFQAGYSVSLAKTDLEVLKLQNTERTRLFTIVTIPDDPTRMTANLKAPIVINVPARIARQCVLQDNNYAIREPIFTKLQQRLVHTTAPAAVFKAKHEGLNYVVPLTTATQSKGDKDFSAEV